MNENKIQDLKNAVYVLKDLTDVPDIPFWGHFFTELFDTLKTDISTTLNENYVNKEDYNKQLNLIFSEFKRGVMEDIQKDAIIRGNVMTMLNGELDNRRYVDKDECLRLESMLSSLKEDVHNNIPKQMDSIVQQCVVSTNKERYIVNPMALGIFASLSVALMSSLISVYLYSLGIEGGTYFLLPIFVGVVTTIFLINEYIKKEGKYGKRRGTKQ